LARYAENIFAIAPNSHEIPVVVNHFGGNEPGIRRNRVDRSRRAAISEI
jgi:hypothetical protein